ncbi:HD domain-containing protein [Paenibacillus tarimensis]|uniref:HD domain-containing protein n=1 Tax=Paenibacillus tarimensis TaxID=416012 RepID=UPI001F3D1F3B|nr:HD domain-containing protein [Paenibacillus tarimensis]MCF2943844.1 HD domain-containing protein [Paenibacillus tarimensis]
MHITDLSTIVPDQAAASRPVFGTIGQPIIEPGTVLSAALLEDMKRLGIRHAVTTDEETRDVRFDELIDSSLWMRYVLIMRKVYLNATAGDFAEFELFDAAMSIVEKARTRSIIVPLPTSSVPCALQPFAHVVNVAIWAAQIGVCINLHASRLVDLTVGCLLHDIGKLLTEQQSEHAEAGYRFVKRLFPPDSDIPHIVLQHQNVPLAGLRRFTLDRPFVDLTRICQMCNYMDHLSCEADAMHYGALEVLMALSNTMFTTDELQALVQVAPKYMPGSTIQVHDGRKAVVVKLTECADKPMLRFIGTDTIVAPEGLSSMPASLVKP